MKIASKKSLLFTALVLTGCGGQMAEESEFNAALPTRDMLEMKAPGKTGQALVSGDAVRALAQGDTSEFYQVTRNTTETVNGGTAAVLGLIERVVQYPPTSVSEDTAVWGPHSEALQKNAWKLTVTRSEDKKTYRYVLSAKDKTAADSTFVDIITGSQTVVLDADGEVKKGYGQGELTLDWDHASKLPDHDANTGRLIVRYARPEGQGPIKVDATFQDATDTETGNKVSAVYGYSAQPGQGGEFDFKLIKDAYQPNNKPSAAETLTIKSRWMATGAGRSDIKLSGGDLAARPATINECWNTTFASRYLKNSYDTARGYGTEATDCAFPSAVYSSL